MPRMQLDRYRLHDIEVVIDRLPVEDEFKVRISQSVQQALKMGKDLMFLLVETIPDTPPPGKKPLLQQDSHRSKSWYSIPSTSCA